MTEKEFKLYKGVKRWNMIASIFFVALCLFMYGVFLAHRPLDFSISIFDIVILSLASFRLIRLFIYDNITLFIRDWFMDVVHADGRYSYEESKNSFKLTMYKLTNCPWCFGIWVSFVSIFFYATFPLLRVVFIALAISGIASFIMLLTNFVGWSAEAKKGEVNKE